MILGIKLEYIFFTILILFNLFYISKQLLILKFKPVSFIKCVATPYLIVNPFNNRVYEYNQAFINAFSYIDFSNITRFHIHTLFDNFKDYTEIKNNSTYCEEHVQYSMLNKNMFKITSNYIEIKKKKYLLLGFTNIEYIQNYINKIGLFSSIIEKSQDGIIALKYDINSNQTLITYANDSICSITGYSKEEILHRPIESLFYMNVDENTLNQLIKSIHLFQPTNLDYQYITKTGEVSWISSTIIPINNQVIKESLDTIDSSYILSEILNISKEIDAYICIHSTNLSDIKNNSNTSRAFMSKLQEIINQKDRNSKLINKCIKQLLSSTILSNNLNYCLKYISEEFDIDRAYIYKIYEKNNTVYMKHTHEYATENVTPEIDNNLIKDFSFDEINGYSMYVDLITGNQIEWNISDLKNDVSRTLLENQNIKSLLFTPIIKNKQLLGYIGLDNCKYDNFEFSVETKLCLKQLADILSEINI